MRIAIFGATSEIAKDLILSFAKQDSHEITLFARRVEAVHVWLKILGLENLFRVRQFSSFDNKEHFDSLINFVGVGSPAQIAAVGANIFNVTLQYDDLALSYINQHPTCRYIFLSSGAAYGDSFSTPVNEDTKATVPINNLQPQDWYGVSKLHAECRHRSLMDLPIVDIRVFNYFSHTQDIEAGFLIANILSAIRDKFVLKTSSDYIVRDYVHPSDFYSLVNSILSAPDANAVVDARSKAPIDKPTLLEAMREKFGLEYQIMPTSMGINATGGKSSYYSINQSAQIFGYLPRYTSLEGVLLEAKLVLAGCLPYKDA